MLETNCKYCRYRYWLAKSVDVHVWGEDCNKYQSDLCREMNDPVFIEYMKGQKNNNFCSYGERKDGAE